MKVTLACNTPADDKLGARKIVLREAEQLELGVEVDRVFEEFAATALEWTPG